MSVLLHCSVKINGEDLIYAKIAKKLAGRTYLKTMLADYSTFIENTDITYNASLSIAAFTCTSK